jgi:hypothetical protein
MRRSLDNVDRLIRELSEPEREPAMGDNPPAASAGAAATPKKKQAKIVLKPTAPPPSVAAVAGKTDDDGASTSMLELRTTTTNTTAAAAPSGGDSGRSGLRVAGAMPTADGRQAGALVGGDARVPQRVRVHVSETPDPADEEDEDAEDIRHYLGQVGLIIEPVLLCIFIVVWWVKVDQLGGASAVSSIRHGTPLSHPQRHPVYAAQSRPTASVASGQGLDGWTAFPTPHAGSYALGWRGVCGRAAA